MKRLYRLRLASYLFAVVVLLMLQGQQTLMKKYPAAQTLGQNARVDYTDSDHGFAIRFPPGWNVVKQPFSGEEIRLTLSFTSDTGIPGLVQVWQIEDLKGFIEQSLLTAPALDNVGVRPYVLAGLKGYFLTYRQGINGRKIYVYDVLAAGKDRTVYRIAYMVPQEKVSQEEIRKFDTLLQSFRLLGM